MKKLLFGIFAHPDDEACGPSATFMKEVASGTELHLICATAGDAGVNLDDAKDLAAVRVQEWHAAGKAIGATSMHMLGYKDGSLANNVYQELVVHLEQIVHDCVARHKEARVSFITFDPSGWTGHLDHIAMSYITTHVFYRLKKASLKGLAVDELAYACLPKSYFPEPNASHFVFMPAGRDDAYINRRVDVRPYVKKKYEIMALHYSQRQDVAYWRSFDDEFHATDHFHVVT